jgi:hypothetical protein
MVKCNAMRGSNDFVRINNHAKSMESKVIFNKDAQP